MSVARLAPLLAVCSCVTAYEPGSLVARYPDGESVTLGGVEVIVQPRASKETPPGAVMLEFRLGNPRDTSVEIDFTALEVELDGELSPPFDPRHELRRARLGPRDFARERIIYRSPTGDDPLEVCVTFHRFVASDADAARHCFHLENRWPSSHSS